VLGVGGIAAILAAFANHKMPDRIKK
jgi:hypothetical protein